MNDKELLLKIAKSRMPYGKYKGSLLIDLPENYILWLNKNGFPSGELGQMLGTIYEIKLNGLEYLIRSINKKEG